MLAFFVGYALGPGRSLAAGQQPGSQSQQGTPPALQGALPPGDYSKMQLAPDQGQPIHYSGAAMRKAHTELQARAKGGVAANPRDLFAPHVTRTHSYIMVHRGQPQNPGQPANGEQHEGVTDVYFVVGGAGSVMVGGELENRRISRPGEFLGPIRGGQTFKVQAGDILNVPPNMAHGTIPDAGGMTYVLMKVNVGLYPWSLIHGTP
jgi:mannose-6-phosphate isomerase-like protein (cupin superfamily)